MQRTLPLAMSDDSDDNPGELPEGNSMFVSSADDKQEQSDSLLRTAEPPALQSVAWRVALLGVACEFAWISGVVACTAPSEVAQARPRLCPT